MELALDIQDMSDIKIREVKITVSGKKESFYGAAQEIKKEFECESTQVI